ncbi:TspO/MBR family protein [Thalassorhabdus alkalitolerans]|uniref:TspO/MBR family protein n=1 Tax=Thalassorhabdus alkalitolerans TaxID=2282697 RepID=A0ABW0YLA1_9BACI
MFKRQPSLIKWGNVIALFIVVIMNALANSLPLNNQTTGEIAEALNILFTPAGYVFSIWTVIYILLAIWVFKQFFSKPKEEEVYENIGYWFVLSCVFNVAWLLFFHYNFFNLTMAAMGGLLISLIMIYTKIGSFTKENAVHTIPFSLYLGWISVATIVNVGILFTVNDANQLLFSDVFWTNTALVLALGIALAMVLIKQNPVYPLVFVWAFFGIGIERIDEFISITYTAWFAAMVLLILTVVNIARHGFFNRKTYD